MGVFMEDIVITSYKQQIKESTLKAEAVKAAGFDIVIEELKNRGVKTGHVEQFFDKIMNSHTIEELDNLTMDEFSEIIDDINAQVTRSLIAKVEIAEALVRKSKLVALSKSPNGKVAENDNYVKVGTNLAAVINKDGIANGLEICIRNYCTQKIYQANYRNKIIEKEKELGIYNEEEHMQTRMKLNEKMSDSSNNKISPKERLLKEIFGRSIEEVDDDISFDTAKEKYRLMINERMKHLQDLK